MNISVRCHLSIPRALFSNILIHQPSLTLERTYYNLWLSRWQNWLSELHGRTTEIPSFRSKGCSHCSLTQTLHLNRHLLQRMGILSICVCSVLLSRESYNSDTIFTQMPSDTVTSFSQPNLGSFSCWDWEKWGKAKKWNTKVPGPFALRSTNWPSSPKPTQTFPGIPNLGAPSANFTLL
jgi:hypothetical protein